MAVDEHFIVAGDVDEHVLDVGDGEPVGRVGHGLVPFALEFEVAADAGLVGDADDLVVEQGLAARDGEQEREMVPGVAAFPLAGLGVGGDLVGDMELVDVDQGEDPEGLLPQAQPLVAATDVAERIAFGGEVEGQVALVEFGDLGLAEEADGEVLGGEGVAHAVHALDEGPEVALVVLEEAARGCWRVRVRRVVSER